MKILHVLTDMDPKMGGVCQAVRTIISGLRNLGIESEVVSLNSADSLFLKEDPFLIHALGPAQGPWAYASKLIPWLIDNFSRFDTVIIHGLWQYHGYAVEKALRQHKLKSKDSTLPKIFVMPHGMLDPYFQRATGRQLKALRNLLYWKLIERKVVNNADGLLFTCEEERQLAREPFRPYFPKQELVVGMGVETPPPYTDKMRQAFLEKCPELSNKPYLLFLSRIHEKKGVDLLIRAYIETFKDSRKSGSEFPWLVLAGPGLETPYGEAMRNLVKEAGDLKDNIFFPGMLAKDAKWGAFYGCESFVLSSHQENFGIAIVEALACGKPVLISKQVNIWREIEAGEAGIVSEDTLAGTQYLLKKWQQLTPANKATLGIHAQSVFEEKFAVDPAAKRLLNSIR